MFLPEMIAKRIQGTFRSPGSLTLSPSRRISRGIITIIRYAVQMPLSRPAQITLLLDLVKCTAGDYGVNNPADGHRAYKAQGKLPNPVQSEVTVTLVEFLFCDLV